MNKGENLYYFDDITVDCENFRVWKNEKNITLTPRAFDVLTVLLQNSGRVVEKQELFDQVWKDTFVSDNALSKIIKEIRFALEDSAEMPRYIETIPKRGYRFIAEVKTAPESKDQPPVVNPAPKFVFSKMALILSIIGLTAVLALGVWFVIRQKNTASPSIRSIAVLPFKPLNAESRDESLEFGMAETLISRLSNLKQIIIRPMSSVRKYTDVNQDAVRAGQEQQTEAVLEGSIQKADDRVRVTVRLIDVRSENPIWSEQFDEKFTDIFKVQDSISEKVTNALTLQLSRQEKEGLDKHHTDNPEAFRLYIKGRYFLNKRTREGYSKSIEYFNQAIELDPAYALAYSGLADVHVRLAVSNPQDFMPKAKEYASKALEIDPYLAEAYASLAETTFRYDWNFAKAENEYKQAINLNPNYADVYQWYGTFLICMARNDEAIQVLRRASELDPLSIPISLAFGDNLIVAGKTDEAIEQLKKTIEMDSNVPAAYYSLARAYEAKGLNEEAVNTFIKLFTLTKIFAPKELEQLKQAFQNGGYQNYLNNYLELRLKKLEIVYVSPFEIGRNYAALGDEEKMFEWFEKAFQKRDGLIIYLKTEVRLKKYQSNARMIELQKKVGF